MSSTLNQLPRSDGPIPVTLSWFDYETLLKVAASEDERSLLIASAVEEALKAQNISFFAKPEVGLLVDTMLRLEVRGQLRSIASERGIPEESIIRGAIATKLSRMGVLP